MRVVAFGESLQVALIRESAGDLVGEGVAAAGGARAADRHSALSHLGKQGASLLMLMAKSRHKKPENLRRYFKPSPAAIAELTSLLAPSDSRRCDQPAQ